MKCPHCGAAVAAGAAECGACGVIFSKLKEKKDRVLRAVSADITPDAEIVLPRVNPWKARAVAAAVVAAWFVAFGLYYRHAVKVAASKAVPKPVSDRPVMMLRDPATGNLKQIPVVVAPSGKKSDAGPPPGAFRPVEPPPSEALPPHDPDFDD